MPRLEFFILIFPTSNLLRTRHSFKPVVIRRLLWRISCFLRAQCQEPNSDQLNSHASSTNSPFLSCLYSSLQLARYTTFTTFPSLSKRQDESLFGGLNFGGWFSDVAGVGATGTILDGLWNYLVPPDKTPQDPKPCQASRLRTYQAEMIWCPQFLLSSCRWRVDPRREMIAFLNLQILISVQLFVTSADFQRNVGLC